MPPASNDPATTRRALLIGNSDGIGLAWTRRLTDEGWSVTSLSRRACPADGLVEHAVCDVREHDYRVRLRQLSAAHGPFDLCAYLVGIGGDFEPESFEGEADRFRVNLTAMVEAMEIVVPPMVARGSGHFVGISSLADDLLVQDCPSYPASKAAMSSYLAGCAPKLRKRGVAITNVRFGFVDTKMAQAPVRPMMVPPERAVDVLMRALRTRPVQISWPRTMGLAVRLGRWLQRPGVWLRRG